jgi:uncharacterized protein YifN (PemK superfamily)
MDLPDVMIKGSPLPSSPGRCADLYHDIRELRLAMEKEVTEVKARESEIKDHLISKLSTSDDTGAAGLKYRVQLVTKPLPKLADWPAFTAWVAANKRFDMLQHRLSDKAVMDWNEQNNNIVPGTERVVVKDVSVTKI